MELPSNISLYDLQGRTLFELRNQDGRVLNTMCFLLDKSKPGVRFTIDIDKDLPFDNQVIEAASYLESRIKHEKILSVKLD